MDEEAAMPRRPMAFADGANFEGCGVSAAMYGARGDGGDATAGLYDAIDAAEASGWPTVFLKPGLYPVSAPRTFVGDGVQLWGPGATVLFQGDAAWTLGTDSHTLLRPGLRDITLEVDGSSNVEAPLVVHNCGGVFLRQVWINNIVRTGIELHRGVLWLRHCDSSMAPGAGEQVIRAASRAGDNGAIFIQGGRFNSNDHGDKRLITHAGLGEVDGLQLLGGVNTAGLDHAVVCEMQSGGHLANVKIVGALLDDLDQAAVRIIGAAGSSVSDVEVAGCKINGRSDSTATSAAQLSIDMSAGTHSKVVRICDNSLDGARDRGVELIGTFQGAVVSRNCFNDYGRRDDAGSRAAFISGAFQMLEVAENTGRTSFVHDYDIEFAPGYSATARRVENNTFGGAGASVASSNP
jgi:hypothetical protein